MAMPYRREVRGISPMYRKREKSKPEDFFWVEVLSREEFRYKNDKY